MEILKFKSGENMEWNKYEKLIASFIFIVILLYIAITLYVFMYDDRDVNMLWKKMLIVLIMALVSIFSFVYFRHERKVNPTFEGKKYIFEISYWELICLFFKKKKCPYCNSKLHLIKKKAYVGKERIQYTKANVYKVTYIYRCDNCNKQIKIADLDNK